MIVKVYNIYTLFPGMVEALDIYLTYTSPVRFILSTVIISYVFLSMVRCEDVVSPVKPYPASWLKC